MDEEGEKREETGEEEQREGSSPRLGVKRKMRDQWVEMEGVARREDFKRRTVPAKLFKRRQCGT